MRRFVLSSMFALALSCSGVAQAGLFHRGSDCAAEPSCGVEAAPSCGVEVAADCCNSAPAPRFGHHLGALKGKLSGIHARLHARLAAPAACDTGCGAAPSCGIEAPIGPSCGVEAAPSCGVDAGCCNSAPAPRFGHKLGALKCKLSGIHARLKASLAAPAACDTGCGAAPSCGIEAPIGPSCGIEAAPSCGVDAGCCNSAPAPRFGHKLGALKGKLSGIHARLKSSLAAPATCDTGCGAAPSCGCESVVGPSCGCE